MSSHLSASASQRKRFSREGFQPIPGTNNDNMAYTGAAYNNDATIDIPLEQVQTNASSAGRRNPNQMADTLDLKGFEMNEKGSGPAAFFRGRRQKPVPGDATGRVGYDGEEDTLTTMGKVYSKILNFSIFTRYLLYVFPLGAVIAIPIIVGSLYNDRRKPKIGGVPINWFFTWVEVIWLSLWVSKLFSHFLPFIFQILVGVVSSGVRKYATVISKLEIPLSLVGWAVTSLATFKPIMTRNPYNLKHALKVGPHTWADIVEKILAAAVVSALVFLAEKLIIQLISINYHAKQFNARIKESKRQIYILGLLYDASKAIFPPYCNEFAEEDYAIADQINLALLGGRTKRQRAHKRTGSTTPMRMLQQVGRVGDKVTSAFGNVAQEITGREVFNPSSSHSIVVQALEKKRTSEALARRIWMSLVVEGREALLEEDIIEVLGSERGPEAEEAYSALDRDGNGDISLDEMIQTVVEWGRTRKAIATSMTDVAQAINVLDRMLCTVVFVAIIFIFIAFLNTNFVTTLATTGTALLSLSFVFSVTAQEILGSCIFLFVKHPFDVGDRVDIAGNPFVVEHISLLFTVFKRASGIATGQLCQYPNIVLNSLALDNVSRSQSQTEQITIDISFDTSFDDIQLLKNELIAFVTDKDNNRDFQPDLEVEILGTTDMSKLQLKVECKHKSNWSNETLRAARRSKFMCALVAALRAVPIYCPGGGEDAQGSAAAPNYNVNISDSEAREAAEEAANERERIRLIPTKKILEAKEAIDPTSRQGVLPGLSFQDPTIGDLHARDPTKDSARDHEWSHARDDSSTLGERRSLDQQDLDNFRGLLHRQSTRGKRKLNGEQIRHMYGATPSVPTIKEPSPPPPASRPPLPSQSSQYQSAQDIPQRSTSNPYRSQQQMPQEQTRYDPTVVEEDDGGDGSEDRTRYGGGNAKPYSGV
jgi:small-conductance mechanosensitive channel